MLNKHIKPQLRTFDLTIIVISLVIGMGIFRTPSEVAAKAGTVEIFFLVWLAGAVVSLFGALTFAEIGSRFPVAGGFYKIFSHCYTPAFAFMVNWITVISNAASTAAVGIMGSAYLAPLIFPDSIETGTQIIAICMVLMLMGLNLWGIKISMLVLNTLMLIKIALLLLLISCVFFVSSQIVEPDSIARSALQHHDPLKAFILCFTPVFFTFGGYQQTMNFGGDVRNPAKTMPRAIFYGIATILILYIAVNFSYFSVLGMEELASTKTLAADVAKVIMGKYVSLVISVVMFFAVMAYVNVSIMSNPRVYYAMAEEGVMPKFFMKINATTQVQSNGVIFFCFFILITLFFMNSFQKILDYVMFFDSISLVTAAAAIFILRKGEKKELNELSIYKMKGYPFIPIVFILVYTAVNVGVLISNPLAFKWGLVLFLGGYPLFLLIRKIIG